MGTKRLLFLCSRNRLRSPTAEAIFARDGIETDSAGLSPDAEVILSDEQIEWADLILVMETSHRVRLNRDYGRHLKGKRIVVLGIPDRYDFMEPALVSLLEVRCARHVT
ncbi:phosphotyrosine protein phosphatase [Luteolibacter flavescens]|uniref:Phosphotyrosine protein phosphatase n=1 Tax=Luteolibacter flavescens TaxID=1859460 RepID=A0ABT3FIZ7_9BACT|nr:phosphotyrosine protein phosphatase [Luteolibacter flavescens]MCW1883545.1 phosphotyrosine protein phosphatase [Luteolibacter flavescens]